MIFRNRSDRKTSQCFFATLFTLAFTVTVESVCLHAHSGLRGAMANSALDVSTPRKDSLGSLYSVSLSHSVSLSKRRNLIWQNSHSDQGPRKKKRRPVLARPRAWLSSFRRGGSMPEGAGREFRFEALPFPPFSAIHAPRHQVTRGDQDLGPRRCSRTGKKGTERESDVARAPGASQGRGERRSDKGRPHRARLQRRKERRGPRTPWRDVGRASTILHRLR